MHNTWREKIMLACAALLVLACGTVFVRFGAEQILVKRLHQDNAVVQWIFRDNKDLQQKPKGKDIPDDEVPVDWAGLYPFSAEAENAAPQEEKVPLWRKLQQKIHKTEHSVDAWTNTNFWQYINWVQLANQYQKNIHWDISILGGYNSVVTLPDGQLVRFMERKDMKQKVDAVQSLAEQCRARGSHFLFILAPGKISPHDTAYAGRIDFSNENADAFLAGLQEAQVDYLDLRNNMPPNGDAQRALFFQTDHHWLPSTARAATVQLSAYLNEHYGYRGDTSLLAAAHYTEEDYPQSWLGSLGKKITLARAQPEGFTLYYPDFSTSFQLEIPSMALKKEGDFSSLYDMAVFDESNIYERSLYGAYAYGDRALEQIRNHELQDDKRLLMVRDSFGDAVVPFLALQTPRLDTIDLRHFNGSLQNYIDQTHPDTVVVLYSIEELNNDVEYKSHKNLFDFR